MAMRVHFTAVVLMLAFGSLALAAIGCVPEAGDSGAAETLATEDVGGAIDSELSTEEDRRGPRWVESGLVLPPGFPVELPIPGGASVADQGVDRGGQSFVVLETPSSASSLTASWISLLESEGWTVRRSGESGLSAAKAESTITATVVPSGSGSRMRIIY
ncbi:MAG: hypothetical protein GY769_03155 [bacterium]|nr:hypothetical protein [bacterium]